MNGQVKGRLGHAEQRVIWRLDCAAALERKSSPQRTAWAQPSGRKHQRRWNRGGPGGRSHL